MTAIPGIGSPRTEPALTAGPAPGPSTGRTALLVAARVLLTGFGVLKVGATVFFTFFASAAAGGDPQGLGDWSVAAWSVLMGTGYLLVAVRLGRNRSVLPLAVGLTAADLVFSVVKLTVYEESASLVFMAVSLVLLALVALIGRRRG
jgi:hypothetical protein